MINIPTFEMNIKYLLKDDFKMYLHKNYDLFFRRILEHVTNRLESSEDDDLLCWIKDENKELYELRLPESGFDKALAQAWGYFEKIEEYETCELLKELKKRI
tara:strand:- start:2980 stop:3285 length:306 start_codon:yes stop_codon:yes gene_type:complete